jgi:D-alanine-D-alanine ligase
MRHSGNVSEKMRVAVLCGGWSSEREVSLVTGDAIAKALLSLVYEVIKIDPVKDLTRFAAQLVSARPDVIFNALHGTGGEDGTIQGALDMSGIPYTHSGLAASSLAMNKVMTKKMAATYGVRCAPEKIMLRGDLAKGHPMPVPYVVKPINEGSSVGVSIIRDDIAPALQGDLMQMVMVEKYIDGMELSCGVLQTNEGLRVLGITQLIPMKAGFYDYASKYTDGMTRHVVNPDLPQDVIAEIHRGAVALHRELGCADVSRTDFRYNPNDGPVLLEINTHPGMTPLSLVPEQAGAAGITFEQLVETILQSALQRFKPA